MLAPFPSYFRLHNSGILDRRCGRGMQNSARLAHKGTSPTPEAIILTAPRRWLRSTCIRPQDDQTFHIPLGGPAGAGGVTADGESRVRDADREGQGRAWSARGGSRGERACFIHVVSSTCKHMLPCYYVVLVCRGVFDNASAKSNMAFVILAVSTVCVHPWRSRMRTRTRGRSMQRALDILIKCYGELGWQAITNIADTNSSTPMCNGATRNPRLN